MYGSWHVNKHQQNKQITWYTNDSDMSHIVPSCDVMSCTLSLSACAISFACRVEHVENMASKLTHTHTHTHNSIHHDERTWNSKRHKGWYHHHSNKGRRMWRRRRRRQTHAHKGTYLGFISFPTASHARWQRSSYASIIHMCVSIFIDETFQFQHHMWYCMIIMCSVSTYTSTHTLIMCTYDRCITMIQYSHG